MSKKGITQKALERVVGVDRTIISRYINGHLDIPRDVLNLIANYLNSQRLKIIANGTTVPTYLFDSDAVIQKPCNTLMKAREKHKEAIKAIDEALPHIVNLTNFKDCPKEAKEKIDQMMDKEFDSNQVSDTVDVVMGEIGYDIEARNQRRERHYQAKGFIACNIRKDTYPKVSVM